MEKNSRVSLTVLILASTIFLISSVSLFFMRQAEIEKRTMLEKRVEALNRAKTKLTKDLDEALAIKNDLEVKLAGLEEKARLLEGQFMEERRSREAVYSQLENEKRESKRVVDDLMRLKDENGQIALSLANVRNECELLKVQLQTVQQTKEILENRLKEALAKSDVELEKIVVKSEAVPVHVESKNISSAGLKGEILVVNKKFDFAVVSLGENVGMEPGMSLGVYRNDKFLAILQVEKVHASMSAAKIPPEAKNIDIREGDTVVVE